jgi:hypothetical protein
MGDNTFKYILMLKQAIIKLKVKVSLYRHGQAPRAAEV